jgi:hypothetical protein
MLLNRIKTLLQINDNDELIYEIVEITKEKILNYINEKELPKELEFILIELAIERFNKIGSEGIASESIDGKNVSYDDSFENYKVYLDDYIFRNNKNRGFKLL